MSIPSYICKTETHANGIISIVQPLGFICLVINCLTAVGGTDVLETSIYLNSIISLLVTRTFINAFFNQRGCFCNEICEHIICKVFPPFHSCHISLYNFGKKNQH